MRANTIAKLTVAQFAEPKASPAVCPGSHPTRWKGILLLGIQDNEEALSAHRVIIGLVKRALGESNQAKAGRGL